VGLHMHQPLVNKNFLVKNMRKRLIPSTPLTENFYNLYRSFRYNLAKLKASYYDKRLGVETSGNLAPLKENISSNRDMFGYQPTFYGVLEKMIRSLHLTPEDVFVDLGCGKGRVVFFMSLKKLKKIIGVELDKKLIDIARKNLVNFKANKTPIEFVNEDAAALDAKEGTVFFMYNPFGFKTLEEALENIKKSLSDNPRKIRIVYYGDPNYINFIDRQDWLIQCKEIRRGSCLVWQNLI
jgi:predicted RNA methylase